jgi:Flp pilus assembly pilin Flp
MSDICRGRTYMKKFTKVMKDLWQDESGAAIAEYVLLLVVVMAIGILFKDRIKDAVREKINDVAGQFQGFSTGN